MRINEITTDLNSASEAEQLAVVKKTPWLIDNISNPSDTVQMAAIKTNPCVIRAIENPIEAAQLIVVQENPALMNYIKNSSSKKVVITAILGLIKLHLTSDDSDIHEDFLLELRPIYKKYRTKYPNWPEWDAIDKSLKTSGMIK